MEYSNYNKIKQVKEEINKYYGTEVNEIFNIDQELDGICMGSEIIENFDPDYSLFISRDEEYIKIQNRQSNVFTVEVNNKYCNKVINRTFMDNGDIQIIVIDRKKEDNCVITGILLYSNDGIFKEEKYSFNRVQNNCCSQTNIITTNVADHILVRKIEILDIGEPSRNKTSHFFMTFENASGMDFRSKKNYISKQWTFIDEDEYYYYKYLINNRKIKKKVKE